MRDNLEIFRKEFLKADTWAQRKDGVPLDLLDKLSPDEVKIAEGELIDSLSSGDSWPILGLAYLKSSAALPKLYKLLDKSSKSINITIAYAVFQICRDFRMIEVVMRELPGITNQYELISVLYLLPAFEDERVNVMLHEFMKHKEYLVAYNAKVALGLPTDEVVQRFRSKETGFWSKIFG